MVTVDKLEVYDESDVYAVQGEVAVDLEASKEVILPLQIILQRYRIPPQHAHQSSH